MSGLRLLMVSVSALSLAAAGFTSGSAHAGSRLHNASGSTVTAVGGSELWRRFYSAYGDYASSVAFAPGGGRVFVVGGAPEASGMATVAYNSVTGAQLWAKRPQRRYLPRAYVAVSPDGGRIFVTAGGQDAVTLAYRAGTGATLWARPLAGFSPSALAVDRSGQRLFVTGAMAGDLATVAYSAATGRQLWLRRYNGSGRGDDTGRAIVVGPGGWRVFVTGASAGAGTNSDYATLAYRTTTGAQLWVRRYNGRTSGSDVPYAIAMSGGRVFVTGGIAIGPYPPGEAATDMATVAYDAGTGRLLWAHRYDSASGTSGDTIDIGNIVTSAGAKLVVSGVSGHPDRSHNFSALPNPVTIRYDAVTGRRLSITSYVVPSGFDYARGGPGKAVMAVSFAANRLIVAGMRQGRYRQTIAYNLATGAQVWQHSYSRTFFGDDATAIAISRDLTRVAVAGNRFIEDPDWSDGYATNLLSN